LYRYRHAGVKGEKKYSSYSFLTSKLDGVSGQRHATTALYSRERTPGTIGYETGWASELFWTQRLKKKSFASAGDRISVVQSVVRHYTD
jgi:hypothetical protein